MEVFVMKWLLLAAIQPAFAVDLHQRSCEPIKVNMCKNIGYNMTSMPNLAKHTMQTDADVTMQTFSPLLQYGCSQQLNLFLCSVYVPMCTDKVPVPIGPCRNLCENVYDTCFPVLNGFGFPWPAEFECSRFPAENNDKTLCMEGPAGTTDLRGPMKGGFPIQTAGAGAANAACKRYARSSSYVYLNRSGRCAQICEAEVLWENAERKLADVWLTVWAALCFLGALIAMGAQFCAGGRGGRPLAMLALCHALVAVGWGIRAVAGSGSVACTRDIQNPTRYLLTQDGLSNPNCAVVFLFLYYFGMAACAWWVVLCGTWRSRLLSRSSNTCSGAPAPGTVVSGLAASKSGTCLQFAVWGIPAAQTLAVLVLRDVDADELTGTCFVGNQSTRSLLALVIIPQILYLAVGCVLLLLGVHALRSPRPAPQPQLNIQHSYVVSHRTSAKEASDVNTTQLGIFVVLYTIPLCCIIASWFYEYFNRDIWLAAIKPSPVPSVAPRPALWIFLLRVLMLQLLGIITSICILSSKASPAWKKLSRVVGPPTYKQAPVKCIPQPIHYYSTTPAHPPLQRVHSHTKYGSHSHGSHRKPRPHHAYPLPLPGGETML